MRQLGFSAQRPLYRAYQQNPIPVERWRKEDLPALQARAKANGAVVLCADEAGMRGDYHAGTTWAPIGRTPIVRTTGQRVSVQMLSAISALGELQFMLHEGRVNADVFIQFLVQLVSWADRPIILVVDGGSIHKAKIVKEYVESVKDKLELYILPPYSPQLNPDELVRKNVKERVAKQGVFDRIELRSRIKAAFTFLRSFPKLESGFFKHPVCGYSM